MFLAGDAMNSGPKNGLLRRSSDIRLGPAPKASMSLSDQCTTPGDALLARVPQSLRALHVLYLLALGRG